MQLEVTSEPVLGQNGSYKGKNYPRFYFQIRKASKRLTPDWPSEEFCFTHHIGIYLPPNILSYFEGLT